MPFSRAEMQTGLVFLLELELAGRRWRQASRACTVGGHHYPGGLDFSLSITDDPYALEAARQTATVRVTLPDLDLPLLRARGHQIQGRPAELSVWAEGRSYAGREVLLSGTVDRAQYDAAGFPVTLSIVAEPPEMRAVYPPADAAITSTTWSESEGFSIPDRSRGVAYPTIIGRPGYSPEHDTAYIGSRAYMCRYGGTGPTKSLILIAGHAVGPNYSTIAEIVPGSVIFTGSGTGTYVYVEDVTDGVGDEREVINARDERGRVVALVESDPGTGGGALRPGNGEHEYVVRWARSITASSGPDAHGIADPSTGSRLGGLGSVWHWVLSLTGATVDSARMSMARSSMDHVHIHAALEGRGEVLQWARDQLGRITPGTLMWGPHGVYLRPWRLEGPPVATLEHRRTAWRDGGVDEDVMDALRQVSVSYCYALEGGGGGKHLFRTTLGADDGASSLYTRRSPGVAEEMETDVLTRLCDASWVAGWRTRVHGQPGARRIRYVTTAEHVDLSIVMPGALVALTDADLHLSSEPALVTGVHVTPELLRLELVVRDEPLLAGTSF